MLHNAALTQCCLPTCLRNTSSRYLERAPSSILLFLTLGLCSLNDTEWPSEWSRDWPLHNVEALWLAVKQGELLEERALCVLELRRLFARGHCWQWYQGCSMNVLMLVRLRQRRSIDKGVRVGQRGQITSPLKVPEQEVTHKRTCSAKSPVVSNHAGCLEHLKHLKIK